MIQIKYRHTKQQLVIVSMIMCMILLKRNNAGDSKHVKVKDAHGS